MLASVGYDAKTQVLELEFVHGAVYQYFDVPPSEYQALIEADSLGQHFRWAIDGTYRYSQVKRKR